MKKVVLLVVVVCLLLSVFGSTFAKDIPDEINIGMIGAITGGQALNGMNMMDALKLVQKEIEDAGGFFIDGKEVKLNWIYEDTEAKPEIAVNATQKLIESDNVIAVLGPNNSADAIAAGTIAQNAGVPLITNTATNVKVTQVGDYIFRACIIDPFQGKVIAKFARENLGLDNVAVIYNNGDAYSSGLYDAFNAAFTELGGNVCEAAAFSGDEIKDFSAQIVNVKASNPQAIFVPQNIQQLPLILQQIRSQGVDAILLGADSWDYEAMPELVGLDVIEGAYYITGFSPAADTAIDFVTAFEELNGYKPSFCSAMMYEAAHILLDSLQRAETLDGKGVRDAIAATDIDVPSGHVTFDADRNPVKSAVVLQVRSGQREYFTTVQP